MTDFLHHPHRGSMCSRELIKHLRDFLTHAGATVPSASAGPGAAAAADDKAAPQATASVPASFGHGPAGWHMPRSWELGHTLASMFSSEILVVCLAAALVGVMAPGHAK